VSQPIEHERAFDLLPWFVNGSLPGSEREAVEEHLRSCLPCRRELKEQQRLRSAVRTQPAVHLSPQGSFDKFARTLGEASHAARRTRSRRGPVARFAAVAVAGVALLGVLFWLTPTAYDSGGEYRTLASPPGGAVEVDVVFRGSVTAAEIQLLLDDIDGEIAAGPTDLGRYTVRLDGSDASARRDDVLARLRADSRVRFAGPALAGEPAR
jgi:putative zinc finger protein